MSCSIQACSSLPIFLPALVRVIELRAACTWNRVLDKFADIVAQSKSPRESCVVTMNSHLGHGLHYPYNNLGTNSMPHAGPYYHNAGGGFGFRPTFRGPVQPAFFHPHLQGDSAFYAHLCEQFLQNYYFNNSERFHPKNPYRHSSRQPEANPEIHDSLQEEIEQIKLGAEKLAISCGPIEAASEEAESCGSCSSSGIGSKTGEDSPDYAGSVSGETPDYAGSVSGDLDSAGSVSGDLDSCVEEDQGYSDNNEYEDSDMDPDHPRGVKRQTEQRGQSPIQKRPRSDDRQGAPMSQHSSWNNNYPKASQPLSDDEYQKISDIILDFYEKKEQAQDLYVKKMKLRDALYSVMKGVFPYCGLYVVGSSMNGFGSNKSDMDLCLMLSYSEIDQKKEATEILRVVLKALKKCSFLVDLNLICAKVPILKFTDKISEVECDLNINNSVGIRNTHLLNAYSKLDWRVSCLVLFVKHWAKMQNINDASQGTISSYSLVLMVIHYLQCGCNPPVVPSLQQKYPHKFSSTIDIRLLTLNEKLPPYSSPNKQSLGELFVGFLNYYTNRFNFNTDAISIRLGRRLPKETVLKQNIAANPPSQWKCLCIEEPFNLSNTARSVFDQYTFQRIRAIISKSYATLRKTGDMSSILDQPL